MLKAAREIIQNGFIRIEYLFREKLRAIVETKTRRLSSHPNAAPNRGKAAGFAEMPDYIRSITMAGAIPPAAHMVTRP